MKEKILVINDDDDIRMLAHIVLDTNGYEVFEASSGLAGIEQAIQHQPDLILLDIVMPQLDGYETCRALKSSDSTKNIPVIFFSSLINPQDKIKGLELGAVDFINNVVDQGELLARLRTHLKVQSLTNDLMISNEELIRKQSALDDDLNAAALIQRSFLPPANLQLKNLELASLWMPANTIGGDIFNILRCGQEKFIAYMADVSGHDVPSALVTMSLSQFFHQQNGDTTSFASPIQTMRDLNNQYPFERFNRYFTIFYIVLDIAKTTFTYICAGHPPGILLSKSKGLKLLESGGTIIGLGDVDFEEGSEALSDGDKVLIYTDGVTERKNHNGEMYGPDRLYSLLEKARDKPVAEIVDSIQRSLNEFGQDSRSQDDISILCFEFNSTL